MATPREAAVSSLIPKFRVPNGGSSDSVSRTYGDRVDSLLLECIDEALTDLLGTRPREAVYDHLERNCFLARSEIPKRLDDFLSLLEDNFGKASKTIGKVIARKLHAKLDWEFIEIATFELPDYLERIKARLARESKSAALLP